MRLFPSYLEMEFLLPLDLFLPKGKNVVCRLWLLFSILLQAFTIGIGATSLWGDLWSHTFSPTGGVIDCTYVLDVVLGGS